MYRQDMGRFAFSPYVGMSKMNTGVYGMGNLTKATFGSTLSYHVNDWLTVGLYGQYVPTNTTDPRSVIMSPFMPKSSYGGFIEVMFNRHWGIGARMGREFAPQKNGKWGMEEHYGYLSDLQEIGGLPHLPKNILGIVILTPRLVTFSY